MKLLAIGFGNMGSAMIKALHERETPLFDSIAVLDHSDEKRQVAREMGLEVWETLESAVIDDETVILLAVKPQDMDSVLEGLKGKMYSGALVVSIAAWGVTLEGLRAALSHDALVRVMPNTPALVGKAASGWIASDAVTEAHRDLVKNMLESFGVAVEVNSEDDLDKVTALSGSGPAYVFYFLEALIEGATELGLSEEQATQLALQTVLGGAELAKTTDGLSGLKDLRAKVTSKGGTTEQAVNVFEDQNFKKIVQEAMKAAYDKTKEF